uniref:Uncharacterized protein n=1 Tax=Rhizophora mucronata TaxID=61149 RepID=A0A2P2PV78_RHIMU
MIFLKKIAVGSVSDGLINSFP